MSRLLKVLAILMLLATIAGAGLVLYGINTMAPVVEQATALATPASQAEEIFATVKSQLAEGTFPGTVFAEAADLSKENCTFITYTLRLHNKGFFPAEWISLEIHPQQNEGGNGHDVLQLDSHGPNALYAKSKGDLAATILRTGDAEQTARSYTLTCYVFGKQIKVQGSVQ